MQAPLSCPPSLFDLPSLPDLPSRSKGRAGKRSRGRRGHEPPAPSPAAPAPGGDHEVNTMNLYISGLPHAVADAEFEALVCQFGQIFSYKVIRKSTQAPPVGFVQYTSPATAQAAVARLDGLVFRGAALKAKMALRDKDKGVNSKPSANLYVCNLPAGFTTDDLRRLFQKFGRIISLVALTNPSTGHSRGTGFVRFSSVKEARVAKDTLHGFQLHPVLPLEVKFAESSAERSNRMKSRAASDPAAEGASAPSTPGSLSPALPPAVPPALALLPPKEHHKKLRPAPLQAPAAMNLSAPLHLAEDTVADGSGLDALGAILEDTLFSPQETAAGPSPLTDLPLALAQPSARCCSHTSLWDTFGPSDEGLSPLGPVDTVVGWERLTGLESHRPPHVDPSLSSALSDAPPGWRLSELHEPAETPPTLSPSPSTTALEDLPATICIPDLPPATTEVDVYRLCAPFGAISQVNLNADPRAPRRTAFVQFRHAADAERARATLAELPAAGSSPTCDH
eukprot:EG_transcript_1107